jgi:macrolide-specific efflux system membrane fusion protein
VFFVVGSAKNVLVVPVNALRVVSRRGERKYSVQVVTDGGIEERAVEVGVMNRTQAEIKSGLKTGDQVVVAETPGPTRRSGGGGAGRFGGPRI